MMYFLNFTKPPTNQSTAQTTKKGKNIYNTIVSKTNFGGSGAFKYEFA